MLLPLLSKRCFSAVRSASSQRAATAVFRQTRQAEVVSAPSNVYFAQNRYGKI